MNDINKKIQDEKEIIWGGLRQTDRHGAYIVIYDYLIAQWGEFLTIYRDGSYGVGGLEEILPDSYPLACVQCPGRTYIDLSKIIEGWAVDNRNNTWTVKETGEKIDLSELLYRYCKDRDVEDWIQKIQDEMYLQVEIKYEKWGQNEGN